MPKVNMPKTVLFLKQAIEKRVSLPGVISALTGTSALWFASSSRYMNTPSSQVVSVVAGTSTGYLLGMSTPPRLRLPLAICASGLEASAAIVYTHEKLKNK